MIILNNYKEIQGQLEELLMEFAREQNQYQTDVYLYIDEDGKGELDTFINVGGNSWLNDDHVTIHSDRPHYEGRPNYESDEEWADYIEECREDYHYEAIDIMDKALSFLDFREMW